MKPTGDGWILSSYFLWTPSTTSKPFRRYQPCFVTHVFLDVFFNYRALPPHHLLHSSQPWSSPFSPCFMFHAPCSRRRLFMVIFFVLRWKDALDIINSFICWKELFFSPLFLFFLFFFLSLSHHLSSAIPSSHPPNRLDVTFLPFLRQRLLSYRSLLRYLLQRFLIYLFIFGRFLITFFKKMEFSFFCCCSLLPHLFR